MFSDLYMGASGIYYFKVRNFTCIWAEASFVHIITLIFNALSPLGNTYLYAQ